MREFDRPVGIQYFVIGVRLLTDIPRVFDARARHDDFRRAGLLHAIDRAGGVGAGGVVEIGSVREAA
jgi:hypothetical protein